MKNGKFTAKKGYEMVMEHLKKQIEDGVLKPGDRLDSVVDLAAQYGVGRSTMREALSALKAMGWLDIRHGGGTFVNKNLPTSSNEIPLFNPEQSLREVLEVRKILEIEAAALAAGKRTEKNLTQLDKVLEQMQLHVHDEKLSEQADVTFHLEIARASQNQLLFRLMDSLSNHLQDTIRDTRRLWFYGEEAEAVKLLQEHQAIYEAIFDADPQLASARMRQHLERVENTLLKRT